MEVLFGDVAQLVERLLCKQEVDGSIPFISTYLWWRHGHRVAPGSGRKRSFSRFKAALTLSLGARWFSHPPPGQAADFASQRLLRSQKVNVVCTVRLRSSLGEHVETSCGHGLALLTGTWAASQTRLMTSARCLDGTDPALRSVHSLLVAAFAYMDGKVDPPSSMARLNVEDLASGPGEVWVVGNPPVACVVLTPHSNSLYIGKLAVAGSERGKGLARLLIDQAEFRAVELGLPMLELETRVELTANQRTFEAMGFVEFERTCHEGFSRHTSITYRRPVPLMSGGS